MISGQQKLSERKRAAQKRLTTAVNAGTLNRTLEAHNDSYVAD